MYLAFGLNDSFLLTWSTITDSEKAQEVADILSVELGSCCKDTKRLYPNKIWLIENGPINFKEGKIFSVDPPGIRFTWLKGRDYEERLVE